MTELLREPKESKWAQLELRSMTGRGAWDEAEAYGQYVHIALLTKLNLQAVLRIMDKNGSLHSKVAFSHDPIQTSMQILKFQI